MIEFLKDIFQNITKDNDNRQYSSLPKYQITTVYILLLVFIFLKLIIDSLFFLIDQFDLNIAIIIRIFLSLVITLTIGFLFLIHFLNSIELSNTDDESKFISDSIKIVLVILLIPLANIFLPKVSEEELRPIPNLLSLIYIQIFSIFIVISGFFIISSLFKWLIKKRHRKSKFQHTLILTASAFVFIIELYKTIFVPKNDDSYTILSVLNGFIIAFAMIVTFITAKKNNWIAALPKKDKWKILGITIFGIIISITSLNLVDNDGNIFIKSIVIFNSADIVLSIALSLIIAFYARIALATILTFPTSKIVERRTYELSSLTYLNRLVANFTEFDKLINTITDLAMKACNASGSWIEIYEADGTISVVSSIMIKKEIINKLHVKSEIVDLFKSINETTIIESIPDKINELPELITIDFAKSIIITPLNRGNERIGTLIVFKLNEYDFEQEELLLMKAFSDNVSIALENSRLLEESILKERYRQELLIARDIEQKLIPAVLPQIPNFSIAGFMIPAEEVGGDYYDVIKLGNGNSCILIGDVSGKGMSAAFYMALLKGVVLGVANECNSAKEILSKINSILYVNMEKSMFITLYAVCIDNHDGYISLARAGHMPAFVKSVNNVKMLIPRGIGIGLANDEIFNSIIEQETIKLNKNDICLLISDGVNELQNESKEEFGFERLNESLSNFTGNNAELLLNHITTELKNFAGREPQKDDMTIFAIIFSGSD
jgi:serine phosphatase RsbU (regulator of sigma subunit)